MVPSLNEQADLRGIASSVPDQGRREEGTMQTIVAVVRSKAEGLREGHKLPLHLGLRGNK